MSEKTFWSLVKRIEDTDKEIQRLTEEKELLLEEKNDLSEELFGVRDGQIISVESLVRFSGKLIQNEKAFLED